VTESITAQDCLVNTIEIFGIEWTNSFIF